jgi:hypothetical protein
MNRVLKNTPRGGLFKNVQMQGVTKTEERGVYRNTSSDEVCSATQQMSILEARAKGAASR